MNALARIIDANLNRAREALRTLEDLARFVVEDEAIVTQLKHARHAIADAAARTGIDHATLLAWRDTPGDVGTRVTAAGEYQRQGAGDIARAAFARAQEAIRSIEECVKSFPGSSAGEFEKTRYEVYEIERLLVPRLGGGRAGQWPLCVLLTSSMCAHHSIDRVAELCVEGGAAALQVREKDMDARSLLDEVRRVIQIARGAGVAVIVNDRSDIALLAGAAGVHVGQTDLSVRDVRRLAGASLLVGVSTSTVEQARRAAADGADYCGVGPMFATTTKAREPIGVGYLREYLSEFGAGARAASLPHLAIGGITTDNVGELVAAGCLGVAVSGAVCGSPDPRGVCERFVAAITRG